MSRSPIFPIPEPHHFSDYGFDPQIDYFQVRYSLSSPRRHVRRGEARGSALDSLHLKLKKPISKEKKQQQQQRHHRRRHWWRSAGSALLLLWKRPKSNAADLEAAEAGGYHRPRYPHRAAVSSGPLYVADGSSSAAPGEVGCRAIRPTTSGPLAAAEVGAAGVGIPYLSLRDLNLLDRRPPAAAAPTPMPIYLVT